MKFWHFVGACAVVGGIWGYTVDDKTPVKSDAECLTDLRCWGERNSIRANIDCYPHVENLAKYSYRWTDTTFAHKFYRFNWADQQHRNLIYYGDRIELQNGFGAYLPHSYSCIYDPEKKEVLKVSAEAGRLPQ